jgi:pentatricopeptide repeat protein
MSGALEVKNNFLSKDFPADPAIYIPLVLGFSRLDDTQGVMQIKAEMEERNCRPNTFLYNAFLSLFARNGDVSTVCQIFDDFVHSHHEPDPTTMAILEGLRHVVVLRLLLSM